MKPLDIKGKRFGRLTVIEYTGRAIKGGREWKCMCDCGNAFYTTASKLNKGLVKSCGCLVKDVASETHKNDITGKRFGRLIAIRIDPKSKRRNKWICRCDCGNMTSVDISNLTMGKVVSCGCYRLEASIKASTTHGETHTRLYSVWKSMVWRCKDKNNPLYGGRGISVCDEWSNYDCFRDWAKNNGYDDSLSIDRIDVNGDYCPENCRFVTVEQQQNNRRNNRLIEYNGKIMTLSQWSEELGINKSTLFDRLKKWDAEKAFTTPIRGRTS